MARSEIPSRHLLGIDALDDDQIGALIERACALAGGASPRTIERSVVNLFFEPSTRTRVSFELAAAQLGMRVVNIELDRSSASKGETLEDTAATLAAMGIDCMVLRHPETGRPRALAETLAPGMRLLNAGDGIGQHPSQALLDAATLAAQGVAWSDLKLAIVGDIRHSRVAGSGIELFRRLGVAELRLAGPPQLLPEQAPEGVHLCRSLDEAVRDADVVMMLRVQRERMDAAGWPDSQGYHRDWGLRPEHLKLARPGCRVMHPGPINRGMEIAPEVADGEQSLILDQVRMGVYTRMAIFEWLFEADRSG
jgi:aspartate carbamoyltransferase catalytic subunit